MNAPPPAFSQRPRPRAQPTARSDSRARALPVGSIAAVLAVVVVALSSTPAAAGLPTAPRPAALPIPYVGLSIRSNGVTPPATVFGAMAYDNVDGYAVMFGGQDVYQDTLGTTWAFAHGNWTNLTPRLSVEPPARYLAASAYDPLDRELVLFGGCPDPQCVPVLGDTWVFSAGHWSDLTPSLNLSPPARAGAMMTFDPEGSGSIVLFGGDAGDSGAVEMNDTWAFHGNRWYAVPPPSGSAVPTARNSAVFQYDPPLHAAILFGGGSVHGVLGDTWSYSNGSWSALTALEKSAPSPRRSTQSVFDTGDGYLLMVGGYDAGAYYGDVWAYGPTGWSRLSTTGAPVAVYGAQITFDPSDAAVIMFSGVGANGPTYDTYAYAGNTWELIINPQAPISLVVVVVASLLVLFLIIGVAAAASYASQRWRLRRSANGFALAPNEPVSWTEPGGPGNDRLPTAKRIAVPLVLALAASVAVIVATGAGSAGAATALLAGFIFGVLLLFIGLIVLVNRQFVVLRVGIASAGVIFGRRAGDTRVAWDQLSPSPFQPPRGRYAFRYALPKGRPGGGWISVSLAQAKAIINSPFAPEWPLTHEQARPVGLEMRTAARRGNPPVDPGGLSSGPLRSEPGPPPPIIPAPPAPSAPRARPRAPPIAAAAPRDDRIRCEKCGQLIAPTGYAFCPACGARLI
ncbi:MAG TPA: zinc ribbon domain-containing protein [Thermoplasmata archaeon]|nr:zinc ribbon domain-containing protein [Thermoplasmata archaeon]